MRDLNKYVGICKQELDSIGIPYKNPEKWVASGRLTKAFGNCHIQYNNIYDKKRGIIGCIPRITISKRVLDERVPEKFLKETIIHEMIHTCDGCGDHGYKFNRYASQINVMLGYNIGVTASAEETKVINNLYEPKKRIYSIECPVCKGRINYKIKCKAYKHPERYICRKCKATLRRVI